MREGSVYAVLAKFKVPVALWLCSALRCVVLLLMTCPRATVPPSLLLYCCPYFLLSRIVAAAARFSAARIFRQTVSMLRCALNNVPFLQFTLCSLYYPLPSLLLPPPTVPNQLSAKYNKLRLLCFGKIMFTLVLSAKSINAIDLKALLSFCCFILLFSFCCCHLLKRFWSAL